MGVQWGAVEEIPNLSNYTSYDFWPDDSFSDASQSMDELLDRNNNSLEQDETFFESLDEGALDEMAREISSDEALQEGMGDVPKLDLPSDGMSGFMAAGGGLLSGAVLGKMVSFVLSKISSIRNISEDNDDLGLDELLDLDDIRNATYKASAESTRNGLGVANAPVGAESAA
jgi:hypothetical protein